MLLLEYPHLAQTTSHLFLRAGWRHHTAQDSSELPIQYQYTGDGCRGQRTTYQSAKSAKAKDPSDTILPVERAGVRRAVVGCRIRELENCT